MAARRSTVDEWRTRFSEQHSAKSRAAEGSRLENAGLEQAPVSASLSPACQPMEGEAHDETIGGSPGSPGAGLRGGAARCQRRGAAERRFQYRRHIEIQ